MSGLYKKKRGAFQRNKNVVLGDGEVRREERITQAMVENICPRCREKVQWRWNFDRYKPLTKPATCKNCKRKVVNKAYRDFCDPCAALKKVCPSCTEDWKLQLQLAKERDAAKGIEENDDKDADNDDDDNCGPGLHRVGKPEALRPKRRPKSSETEEMSSDDETELVAAPGTPLDSDPTIMNFLDEVGEGTSENNSLPKKVDVWTSADSNIFQSMLTSKYSKNRKTGTEEDQVIAASSAMKLSSSK
jgi:hypothetical protein